MVAHFTMRTHGVNQAFRFVEGIWLHRQSRHLRFFSRYRPIFIHACATCYKLPSNIFRALLTTSRFVNNYGI